MCVEKKDDEKINCLEKKMVSKKMAYVMVTITIAVIGLFFAFINIY